MHSDSANSAFAAAMIDADHPAVLAMARVAIGDATNPRDQAVRLYYTVRDGIRYDPYRIDLSVQGLKASQVLADGFGWCVPKAALLAAACRAVGIPARVGLADVRNHLSTARLREAMGTDMFYGHGYTTIKLNGRWIKATPAFNVELCSKMNMRTLEFDGTKDSIYHPFDRAGQRHMEYVRFRGEFDDMPRQEILAIFAEHYPRMARLDDASWEQDVAGEARGGPGQCPHAAGSASAKVPYVDQGT
jgi:transglutaminase-like putative cysteine protease